MSPSRPPQVTAVQVTDWLSRWQAGDKRAEDQLMEAVYSQLHAMAARFMLHERPGHTLSPTALVHEAWLRMHGGSMDFESRACFLGLSAKVMRRVLIDHARARARGKRFDGKDRVDFDEAAMTVAVEPGCEPEKLLDLDRALTQLAAQDERKGRLMEMVYFGGMNPDEAAAVLQLSPRTVQREVQFSRLWLKTAMQHSP